MSPKKTDPTWNSHSDPAIGIFITFFLLVLGNPVFPNDSARYSGFAKCKVCHLPQFKIWDQSPHKTAFEKLSAEEQVKEECVVCHVTGHGKAAEGTPELQGVQCEACHGPGSLYRRVSIMSKSKYNADPAGQRKLAIEAGLILPGESTCRACHNEKSPNFKGFNYKEAKEKIRHWDLE
ncbi:MAG: cytochrome c family protein [Acidobacteriota bacterium]